MTKGAFRVLLPAARAGGVALALFIAGQPMGSQPLRPAELQAQEAKDLIPPPSAALLRRLASTADAFRTGDMVYIVASPVFPHDVVGAYRSLDGARFVADSAGTSFYAYGPYVTPQDSAPFIPLVAFQCYKDRRTTKWVCPNVVRRVYRFEEIETIDLTFNLTDGNSVTVTVEEPPAAFVLTLDAFDRFIVPYYTRLFGPDYVARMRADLLSMIAEAIQ